MSGMQVTFSDCERRGRAYIGNYRDCRHCGNKTFAQAIRNMLSSIEASYIRELQSINERAMRLEHLRSEAQEASRQLKDVE
jgi:hypothetical protein